ncbi:MAG: hypothetical protein H6654_00990 [Ardenticatenaceae bacterium]|nr:hypothetical protein [Anaerolineales bacterium]MCB8940762.1 hypothetical protein [Ardenticatenaceae bacterium]MCB8972101.1 hypothetical protein [Ardenticatenaceae bacterium]
MDTKLKEAIATIRAGDKQTAQRQLTSLLEENPQEEQGWYLLSLLVDSPQKQATYLSKTLALNPNHAKAKEQLETLHHQNQIAPTSTIDETESLEDADFFAQAESDSLPDWLEQEDELVALQAIEEDMVDTAVPNTTIPDWLKEPVVPAPKAQPAIEEEPTAVAQTIKPVKKSEPSAKSQRPKQPTAIKKTAKKQLQKAPRKNAASLNIILSVLVLLALIVMVLLAYLIFI